MIIPQIIHFTWSESVLPEHFRLISNTWKKYHPDWDYRLWTDEMNREFVSKHYPDFLEDYDAFPEAIQRADAIRYFILYFYGGVYADLDMECLKNIQPLLNNRTCLFGREKDFNDSKSIMGNAIMASTPGHRFIKKICDELYNWRYAISESQYSVLDSTGPLMISRVYEKYEYKEDVAIEPSELLYPLSQPEVYLLYLNKTKSLPKIEKRLAQAYTLHYFWGTWWKSENSLLSQTEMFLESAKNGKF